MDDMLLPSDSSSGAGSGSSPLLSLAGSGSQGVSISVGGCSSSFLSSKSSSFSVNNHKAKLEF